jgi:hypothetical protein
MELSLPMFFGFIQILNLRVVELKKSPNVPEYENFIKQGFEPEIFY